MSAGAPAEDWAAANQRKLMAELASLAALLRGDASREASEDRSPTLDALAALFGLSPFERRLMLLCAGIELDGDFASHCGAAPGSAGNPWPSFGLALAAFPDAHWDAMAPRRPLRHWRMIEVVGNGALVSNRLQIDERMLFFLTGVTSCDERLTGLVEPLRESPEVAQSQQPVLESLAGTWELAFAAHTALPALQLCGPDAGARRTLAAALAARLGIGMFRLQAALLPVHLSELENLHRLWEREAILRNVALMLDSDRIEPNDAPRELAIDRWIELSHTPLLVSSREPRRGVDRPLVTTEVARPTKGEQRAAWQRALGAQARDWNGALDRLVSQFDFSSATIQATATSLPEKEESVLWEACRRRARPRIEDLAQRLPSTADWSSLVLPAAQMQLLREIAMQARHRAKVCEEWGFAEQSARGLGLSALFCGPSGTGKTLAAEILAREMRLDLFRIDLSAVVSKYIGETEKNLRRVFDAAEEGGAVLLFDEADALFGKRSEVKDSHDRYANVEISYLLQRMEAYRGLAILTTNMKDALDLAFLRRLRFLVTFPFPDQSHRAEIWRRIFPARTPTECLDVETLSRLSISGGNIRSIALNAAFAAADAGEPVRMGHLLHAVRAEYVKLEKPLTGAEIGGWSNLP